MSVLQLALKHLDELSYGTRLGTVPLGHPSQWDAGTGGTGGTLGTVGTDRRCFVCGQPARFGFGVRLVEGKESRWTCAAHRPHCEGRA
jgi:hypothetical protein